MPTPPPIQGDDSKSTGNPRLDKMLAAIRKGKPYLKGTARRQGAIQTIERLGQLTYNEREQYSKITTGKKRQSRGRAA